MSLCHVSVVFIIFLATISCEIEYQCFAEECPARTVALVPARAGSKGIERKNLSRIGNGTLVARAIKTIRRSGQFDSVWVSTDDAEIAEEALFHGAQVQWRDPATATDNASTISAVQEFLRSHKDLDVLAVIQCTSPFLQPEFLSSAFHKMITKNLDCVFSATRVFGLRWTDSEDGVVRPLNFDPGKRPRRQDWNGELIENGMFYFAKKELITMQGVLQNSRCGVWEVAKEFSLEIDSERDLLIARKISELIDSGAFS